MTIPTKLREWISNWLSIARLSTDFQVNLLLGDGSNRSFYRVTLSDRSFILISDPQWTQTKDYPDHQRFLKSHHLPVPDFFAADSPSGFLLMEDLGDELLQQRILKSLDQKNSWLKKTTSLLADLHGKTYPVPQNLPVASRAFDREKYYSELNFTLEHLNDKLLKFPKLNPELLGQLDIFCGEIAQINPLVFSHRDYHCRNLLLKAENLVMIDFQDARMGSPHYDLASLIYDAYVPITSAEREELVTLYLSSLKKYAVHSKINQKTFSSDLKRVAFQRVVKAAGSFASFYTRFNKNTHLPYLVPALEYAMELQQSGHGVPETVLPLEKWIAQVKSLKIK